jgi:hypothetical protein
VRDGVWTLAIIDLATKRFEIVPTEFTDISQLRAAPGRAVFIGGSPSEPPALIDPDLRSGRNRVVRRASVLRDDVRRYVSLPHPIASPTEGGETAHAFYYPPFSPEFAAPDGEKAPGRCHVWTAPADQGLFSALRGSWVRSCLRPSFAENRIRRP